MAMQKLNVRFSDETKLKISELAEKLGVSDSDLARDAMEDGLFHISESYRMSLLQEDSGDSHLQEDLLK